MVATVLDRQAARARTLYLRGVAKPGNGARRGVALLLGDTAAAIAFAAGLARAITASPEGWRAMLPWLALALGAGMIRGVIALALAMAGADDARAAKLALRRRIASALFRQRAGVTAGAMMSAAVDDVEAVDGYVSRFLPARIAAGIAPLLVLAATAWASPIAAGILAATLLPFILAMALAGGAAADQSRRQFMALARLSSLFGDRIRALPIVLAFGGEARSTALLHDAAEDLSRRTMRVLRVAFLSSAALEFFAALSVALVAVYAGFNLLGLLPFPVPEKLDLARAFFVLAVAPEFYAPMRRLAAAYHDKQSAETAAERLAAVEREAGDTGAAARITCPTAPALRFHDVAIRYDEGEAAALSGFSLDVKPGEMVAMLGPSGSGKSSLLHLLLGLAPLSDGRLTVDGRPIDAIGSVAPIAAWMGQNPLMMAGTIRDNIALARPDADDAAIDAVARAAGLGPMLLVRPQGLDSPIDERGGGLSGGERRRIALARALLKGAPLMLLDEPTAHLDEGSEAALIATIADACAGRTTLIATHSARLAAIADRIIRLERKP
ncbi:thiol reductant ABC exporter subunit CydD [Sphingomonas sp.]|uniref:thiol reductant ABC exporter subunit CydD n=1 Tax=Sphingomonas sp. TaxID=28214 RepID=UPI000DB27306|nr:thiol reductant ABC exporter subunit CydD [Sphingomonas sp.]PZU11036.1 MAG: thiol reductant ABC exporter subunit CydD [Sphingomonas sp.]